MEQVGEEIVWPYMVFKLKVTGPVVSALYCKTEFEHHFVRAFLGFGKLCIGKVVRIAKLNIGCDEYGCQSIK